MDDLDHLGTDALISQAARDFAERCRDLAEDPPTSYAADTLLGMALTAEQDGIVTARMREAVENIRAGAERAERNRERGGSRRYEGWGR
jgi:hypothetical protein